MVQEVEIYTDGACTGNPGPGGWAAILFCKGASREIHGFSAWSTNNQMELMAAIMGLHALNMPCKVKLYSDSAYLCNAFNNGWLKRWQRNGWVNKKREPVANRELWEQLLKYADIHQIVWNKVKGHSDNIYNNRCDELARLEIKNNT